jgi:hypothetical protein
MFSSFERYLLQVFVKCFVNEWQHLLAKMYRKTKGWIVTNVTFASEGTPCILDQKSDKPEMTEAQEDFLSQCH